MCKEGSERARTKGFFLRGHNTSIGSRTYVSRAMVYPHTHNCYRCGKLSRHAARAQAAAASEAVLRGQTAKHAHMQACTRVPADAVEMGHWQAIRMNSWHESTLNT